MITIFYIFMLTMSLVLALFSGVLSLWIFMSIREEKRRNSDKPLLKEDWRWP